MTVGSTTVVAPNANVPPQDARLNDTSNLIRDPLDGYIEADLDNSTVPHRDRIVGLLALVDKTPTGNKLLQSLRDLGGVHQLLKFQMRADNDLSKVAEDSRVVWLNPDILNEQAKEIGVSPDMEHACELLNSLVDAHNRLAGRIEHTHKPINAEAIVSTFRQESRDQSAQLSKEKPSLPPPPNLKLVHVKESGSEARPPMTNDTAGSTMRSTASEAPSDPSDTRIYEDPVEETGEADAVQQPNVGKARRFFRWVRRTTVELGHDVRRLFTRHHTLVKRHESERSAKELPSTPTTPHRPSTVSNTPRTRHESEPVNTSARPTIVKTHSTEGGGSIGRKDTQPTVLPKTETNEAQEPSTSSAVPKSKHRRTPSLFSRFSFKKLIPHNKHDNKKEPIAEAETKPPISRSASERSLLKFPSAENLPGSSQPRETGSADAPIKDANP